MLNKILIGGLNLCSTAATTIREANLLFADIIYENQVVKIKTLDDSLRCLLNRCRYSRRRIDSTRHQSFRRSAPSSGNIDATAMIKQKN